MPRTVRPCPMSRSTSLAWEPAGNYQPIKRMNFILPRPSRRIKRGALSSVSRAVDDKCTTARTAKLDAPTYPTSTGKTRLKMLRGERLGVCTLNVRTLNQLGGKELLDAKLRKFNIRIAGQRKVRWPSSGELGVGDTTYLLSGRKGVAIAMAQRILWRAGHPLTSVCSLPGFSIKEAPHSHRHLCSHRGHRSGKEGQLLRGARQCHPCNPNMESHCMPGGLQCCARLGSSSERPGPRALRRWSSKRQIGTPSSILSKPTLQNCGVLVQKEDNPQTVVVLQRWNCKEGDLPHSRQYTLEIITMLQCPPKL